ncbi:MAG: hypothetical protein HRT68_13610, partial [Flavobacteriaceae bacterium]|nr:hypothetical protein [Flavobacteriaceae bacterium]
VKHRTDDEFVPSGNFSTDIIKDHHTVGMKIMKPDGSTYVYGESAYNKEKVEATFDVSKRRSTADCATGLIAYNEDLKSNRSTRSDGFFNRIVTPAYSHSYLLSSVLSADFEDLTGNGPTDDDLGAYTLFHYKTHNNAYKWRVPFQANRASYNEGLKSHDEDEKANYIYGEKEIKYIQKIETKTHVAFFRLSDREDARGVAGESGGMAAAGEGTMQKLDKIYLFSKPEYAGFANALENDDPTDDPDEQVLRRAAIKIAHFEYVDYDYDPATGDPISGEYDTSLDGDELCQGIPNNAQNGGKLTLDKVYFTYRGSNMGKHTPYRFNYADFDGDGTQEANYPYNLKGYDIWGCYKPNEGTTCAIDSPLTTMEFPFVEQDKTSADQYTRAWCLSSIDLPSGGRMEIELESDDYQYVQEKQAMQMFKVVGAGGERGAGDVFKSKPTDFDLTGDNINRLYSDGKVHSRYLYARISDQDITTGFNDVDDIVDRYFKEHIDNPIFFRFLLNMERDTNRNYDFVEGYFLLEKQQSDYINFNVFEHEGATYLSIPMDFLELEGVANSGQAVNPISKAAWYFGRTYLNTLVYGMGNDNSTDDFEEIVLDFLGSFASVIELFESPNGTLENKGVANEFVPEKSWIRLLNPNKQKLGGGCRVTKVQLHDEWDIMTNNDGDANYHQFYGQEYDYTNDDGGSSGVATFEPNSSKENPYVEPFFDKQADSYRDKINSPREANYVEKPIGAAFFPSPTITYGKVTVKNLTRERPDGSDGTVTLKKHATGKVVTEHFTSKDFPTISNFTAMNAKHDRPTALSRLLRFSVKNHMTLSQGFTVITNDMNGKMKKQEVFAEDKNSPISGVEYVYSTKADNSGELNNELTTINRDGTLSTNLIGLDYEVINDFRQFRTKTTTGGVNANMTMFLIGLGVPIFAPFPLPTMARHENQLRTATTMKHLHKNGIMVEKIAYDLGSKVSTKNLAWDNDTGQVLLTETINEYDDNYYNFTYPAYWSSDYETMGRATRNIQIKGQLWPTASSPRFRLSTLTDNTFISAEPHFVEGDEITIYSDDTNYHGNTYWVAGVNSSGLLLMDREGMILNECELEAGPFQFKITRSGYRNQQMASMASVTSMINPIDLDGDGIFSNPITNNTFDYQDGQALNKRVINASAIEYQNFWLPQDEYRMPVFHISGQQINNEVQHANPYIYNVKGEWRALKSYAYLTGRNYNQDATAPGA